MKRPLPSRLVRRAPRLAAGLALLAAAGGCASVHSWFAKGSGSPAHFGASVDVPLGSGQGR